MAYKGGMEVLPLKHRRTVEQAGAIAVLLVLVVCCLLVLRPFLTAMLWAAILTFATWPVFSFIRKYITRGNAYLAAAILTLSATLVVVVPFVVLAHSSVDVFSWVTEHIKLFRENGLPRLMEAIRTHPIFAPYADAIKDTLTQGSDPEQVAKWAFNTSRTVGEWLIRRGISVGYGLFQMAFSLLFMFYFYVTGEKLAAASAKLMEQIGGPFMGRLQWRMGRTLNTVVRGTIGTAIVQGVAGWMGYTLFEIPHAGLFAVLTFILGLLPFGPPVLWIPIGLWLLGTGRLSDSIGMMLYGGLIISSIDNVVRPFLIAGGGHLPAIFARRRALATGLVLGLLSGVAFAFCGLPWGFGFAVAALVAFSPFSGATEVALLSGVIWLFVKQQMADGLWLLFFFFIMLFLHPFLSRLIARYVPEKAAPRRSSAADAPEGDSFAIMLIGVIGGLMAFGFMGLFIGPVLLALGYDFIIELSKGAADIPAPPPQKENDSPAAS